MAVKPIPEGYHSVTPYLLVEGGDGSIVMLADASTSEGGRTIPALPPGAPLAARLEMSRRPTP